MPPIPENVFGVAIPRDEFATVAENFTVEPIKKVRVVKVCDF